MTCALKQRLVSSAAIAPGEANLLRAKPRNRHHLKLCSSVESSLSVPGAPGIGTPGVAVPGAPSIGLPGLDVQTGGGGGGGGGGTSPTRYSFSATRFRTPASQSSVNPTLTTAAAIGAVWETAGGSGYSSGTPPTLLYSNGATATGVVNASGQVTGWTLTNGGSAVTVTPTSPTITQNGGTGAVPIANLAASAWVLVKCWWVSPDYACNNPQIFLSTSWSNTSGSPFENPMSNALTVEGWSINVGGTWHVCDNPGTPGVAATSSINTTLTPGGVGDTDQFGTGNFLNPGVLLPKVTVAIPVATKCEILIALKVPVNTRNIPQIGAVTLPDGNGENAFQSLTGSAFGNLSSGLTTGGGLSPGSGVFLAPTYVITQGGDGRPAFLLVGSSGDMEGPDDQTAPGLWSSRYAFGHVDRALDDNSTLVNGVTTKRLPFANFAVAGQGPASIAASGGGWNFAVNWRRKINAMLAPYNAYGALPFDYIISGHFGNSVDAGWASYSQYQQAMGPGTGAPLNPATTTPGYFALLKALFGVPIIQSEGQNVVENPGNNYFQDNTQSGGDQGWIWATPITSAGNAWQFRNDISGLVDPPNPSAYFRANNWIIDSFGPWRNQCLNTSGGPNGPSDPTGHPASMAVQPAEGPIFTSTLTAQYTSGTTVQMAAAPPLGSALMFGPSSTSSSTAGVVSVTGTGPYTVSLNGSLSATQASGTAVTQIPSGGLHPSALASAVVLNVPVLNWKYRVGYHN